MFEKSVPVFGCILESLNGKLKKRELTVFADMTDVWQQAVDKSEKLINSQLLAIPLGEREPRSETIMRDRKIEQS